MSKLHISRSCLRCSLLGGGSDIPSYFNKYGGLTIGFAIDKYAHITCRRTPNLFKHHGMIQYSKVEKFATNYDIEHNGVRGVFQFLQERKGYEIVHMGCLPAQTGTGSSSAFIVALLKTMWTIKNVPHNNKKLARTAIHIERELLKETGGWQDQVFATYGNFNAVTFANNDFKVSPIDVDTKPLLDRIVLLYTGSTRKSFEIAKSYETKSSLPSKRDIHQIAQAGLDHILQGDWDEIGPMLHASWQAKRGISDKISNSHVDDIYKKGLNLAATGGKLLGNGGSGFFLFYLEEGSDHKEFVSRMGLSQVKFKVDYEGAKVIA